MEFAFFIVLTCVYKEADSAGEKKKSDLQSDTEIAKTSAT